MANDNVVSMPTNTVDELLKQAEAEVQDEFRKKAVEALKRKLRDRENAMAIVRNLDREIADLKASIADGSFAG